MEYVVGIVLGLFVCLFAKWVGFDHNRAFYPTMLVVIASYYILFAVMAGSVHALLLESAVATGFLLVAIAGFKLNLWFLVGGLAAHGVFDFIHGHLITNPGVPAWWPMFCLTFDVTVAAYLAWLLNVENSSG